jgi:hypothetical protein
MTKQKLEDQYSEEESEQRFLAAVKAGLNTKPKHRINTERKAVPKKRSNKRPTLNRGRP